MSYKLSIITINYNQAQGLESTIMSVNKYLNNDVQYIIIDGASTDNSTDIIKRYEKRIDYWISEKDNGIYNAMNKGIMKAQGKWSIFMNSGDTFAENFDLSDILDSSYDVIYGDCIVNKGTKKRKKGSDPKNMIKGMCFCHQAMFFKTVILKNNMLNEDLKISGDYEQIFRIYNQGYKFKRVDKNIASISSGGLSDKKRIESLIESYKVCKKYKTCHKLYFMYRIFIEFLKIPVKRLLKK